MKINRWQYMHYLWTGYMWGRFFSILYSLIDSPENWPLLLFYAYFIIFYTTFDITEIRTTEKKWFDTKEESEEN